ncbi:MAG: SBBP repeat-containing protein [Terriglobales bacterium]
MATNKTGKTNKTGNTIKVGFLAAAVLAAAGLVLYFGTTVHAAKAQAEAKPNDSATASAQQILASQKATKLQSLSSSLPMFFEPNQGQTDPQVKFVARGAGYGLFLTADEAVLELQQIIPNPRTATAMPKPKPNSVIRMRLAGANTSAHVSGNSPLGGKSNYFVGSDPSKWRHNIPQFARVQYEAVYPGVDLVYYGNQGQLEYDFRVAPGADPNQIALNFTGASTRIDSANSGDLVLSTANGDIRFHAPHVYQPSAPMSGNSSSAAEKTVQGNFRQLADNQIGFVIGDYDHSRELVIDPLLSYSTYLGAGGESLVKIAVDAAGNIYLAGSTTSTYFFPPPVNGQSPPLQNTLSGTQNLFIAEINPSPQLNSPTLLYATYLGGNEMDSMAGIAVDSSRNIYVAGTTTSTDFPTTPNAFQTEAVVQGNGGFPGTHGFLSAITLGLNGDYTLTYSTYLAGNGIDTLTGMAIDNSCITQGAVASCNAYLTGVTTSSNGPTGFPANAEAYQKTSNSPGNAQFFASKIYTAGSGVGSMLYSTYFGGGNFGATDIAVGGGIAVDPASTNVSMYFTGATNQLSVGSAPFPIFNAQQSCLNLASKTNCPGQTPTNTPDAFVAKINPNNPASVPVYSTYLGGSGSDYGNAIAVDSSSKAYVVGSTSSPDWSCACSGFQTSYFGLGGAPNGFIAVIGNLTGSTYPLSYFTYLGGTGPDSINDIKVDSLGGAHVVGTTGSPTSTFPVTKDTVQSVYGGGTSDAFFALILTQLAGTFPLSTPPGDYSSYLGGGGTDVGTGVAIDVFGATYAAGATQSGDFPVTAATAYQPTLAGTQDAFVSKIGASSILVLSVPNTSPAPNPVGAGNQIAFTFDITNTGTDNANLVVFNATGIPTTGLTGDATAKITMNTGSCGAVQGTGALGGTISCSVPSLAVNQEATIEVDMTPSIPVLQSSISIAGNVSSNGGAVTGSVSQPIANIVDFSINAVAVTPSVVAGDTATIQVFFCPTSTYGYSATITPSDTIAPSMVTATTPTFNPTTVTLAGTACGSTTLSIATVARPTGGANLLRRQSTFYATWLPVGGLSLIGLGIGAGRKRRGLLLGVLLCLMAGILLVQPGCGGSSTTAPTPGGTLAQTYTITVTGNAGGSASHQTSIPLQVN